MLRVTLLEPRTLHQPGKLRTCQRTITFLRFRFWESMKNAELYLLCMQSSAACPQASDRIWCSGRLRILPPSSCWPGLRGISKAGTRMGRVRWCCPLVKISVETALDVRLPLSGEASLPHIAYEKLGSPLVSLPSHLALPSVRFTIVPGRK